MRTIRIGAALAMAASLAVLPGCGGTEDAAASGQAIEVSACQDAIATLRAQTLVVRFAQARDQTGLVGKLDEASTKLSLGKLGDAVLKLGDYRLKVETLIAQGKIFSSLDGTVTPQMLVDGAQAAIDCIFPPPPPDPAPITSGI
jgi:hypothetical protein